MGKDNRPNLLATTIVLRVPCQRDRLSDIINTAVVDRPSPNSKKRPVPAGLFLLYLTFPLLPSAISVAFLSQAWPKWRTPQLFVKLRTDKTPRVFRCSNPLSPVLTRFTKRASNISLTTPEPKSRRLQYQLYLKRSMRKMQYLSHRCMFSTQIPFTLTLSHKAREYSQFVNWFGQKMQQTHPQYEGRAEEKP